MVTSNLSSRQIAHVISWRLTLKLSMVLHPPMREVKLSQAELRVVWHVLSKSEPGGGAILSRSALAAALKMPVPTVAVTCDKLARKNVMAVNRAGTYYINPALITALGDSLTGRRASAFANASIDAAQRRRLLTPRPKGTRPPLPPLEMLSLTDPLHGMSDAEVAEMRMGPNLTEPHYNPIDPMPAQETT